MDREHYLIAVGAKGLNIRAEEIAQVGPQVVERLDFCQRFIVPRARVSARDDCALIARLPVPMPRHHGQGTHRAALT